MTTRRGWNTNYAGEKYLISELDFKYLSIVFINVATQSPSTTLAESEFMR